MENIAKACQPQLRQEDVEVRSSGARGELRMILKFDLLVTRRLCCCCANLVT